MKSYDCLKRTQEIFGSKLLEASAGTGKTFSIEHLFVRLLLEGKNITVDQILVVTFTNAATRELKTRIRSNLQSALKMLEKETFDSLSWDYLVLFYGDREAYRRLEDALFCFDTAQIFTIHGFCYRMLTEFFLDAQFSLETEFLQGNGYEQKILIDFLHFGVQHYLPEQIDVLLSQSKNDIHSLLKKLASSKLNETSFSIEDSYKEFKQVIRSYPEILQEDSLLENFASIYPHFKEVKPDELNEQLHLCCKILNRKACNREEYRQLLRSKLTIAHAFMLEKRKVRSKYEISELPPLIDWLRKFLYPCIESALDPKNLIEAMAGEASSFLEKRLEQEKKITPDFLLKRMSNSLKHESFLQNVQQKYKASIIDEFQDTDSLQWGIFHSLFWNQPMEAFYLVGDPKQSIYRFRGADPDTYLKVRELFGSDRLYQLNVNYRSEKSLVDSLNNLFSHNEAFFSLRRDKSHLPYTSVTAASEKVSDSKALHCLIGKGRKKHFKESWPTTEMENELFFPFIANEIHSVRKKGRSFSEIAILIKDRFQQSRLKQFLGKQLIPCASESIWEPSQSPILDAIEHLFHVVSNPRNSSRCKALLGTPFFQYDLKDLQNLELDESYISPFFSLKETIHQEGLAQFFQEFMKLRLPKKGSVLENLSCLEDLSLYEETMAFIEILLEKEKSKCFQISHFERTLQEIRKSEESNDIQFSKDDEQVRMLTIHKSKGLEFEIVFIPGLMQRTHPSCEEEALQFDEEKLRHFYVSLTRAKERAYLFFAHDENQKVIPSGTLSPCELFLAQALHREDPHQPIDEISLSSLFTSWEGFLKHTFLKPQSVTNYEEEKAIFLSHPKKPKDGFPHISTFSFTALARPSEIEVISNEVPKEELPAGAVTGELLHRLIEKALTTDRPLKMIIEEESKNTLFSEYPIQLYKIVEQALRVPLHDFTLQDVSKNQMQVEMEFFSTFEETPHFIKGFIDLFFFHNGKYYLLDWKSNYLSSYDSSALEDEMKKHDYLLQAAIYAEAAKRYLKQFEKASYEFGGMFYVFLRGLPNHGVYFLNPDLSLIDERRSSWDL